MTTKRKSNQTAVVKKSKKGLVLFFTLIVFLSGFAGAYGVSRLDFKDNPFQKIHIVSETVISETEVAVFQINFFEYKEGSDRGAYMFSDRVKINMKTKEVMFNLFHEKVNYDYKVRIDPKKVDADSYVFKYEFDDINDISADIFFEYQYIIFESENVFWLEKIS